MCAPRLTQSDASLSAVLVGRTAPLGPGRVPSAFVKAWCGTAVVATERGLAGDEQADLRVHGGPDMAIYAYPSAHYAAWAAEFPEHADLWSAGSLGENLAVDGWDEHDVCIGDLVSLGSTLLQVTRPRKPCFKLALRFGDPRLPRRLVQSGRCGWYFRVLRSGAVAAGDGLRLLARPHPGWTIRRVNDLGARSDAPLADLQELAELPELAANWRRQVQSAIATLESDARRGRFRPFRVDAIERESHTITSFRLTPADGRGVPVHEPGQHLALRLPQDGGGRLRSYTITSAPGAPHFQISVKRGSPGGASDWLHAHLAVGSPVEVLGPRGTFTLGQVDDLPVALISAGVGITPMVAMLQAATTNNGGRILPRRVLFIHGARDGRERAFSPLVADIVRRHPAVHAHVRFSAPGPSDALSVDHDSVGHIDAALLRDLVGPLGACRVYLCGPLGFMRDVSACLLALGLPPEAIRAETFGGSGVSSGAIDPSSRTATITFSRSGTTATWDGDRSLLDLAEAGGCEVSSECRAGLCGLCATPVLAGTVDYETEPVASIPPEAALLCCARPRGEHLVLDL